MIGKICTILTPFYDVRINGMSMKKRPALVIGMADGTDMTLLPVSSISDKGRVNPKYDVLIEVAKYPLTGLKHDSYIRTNKVFTANLSEVNVWVGDVKSTYPDLFVDVMGRFEEYAEEILKNM